MTSSMVVLRSKRLGRSRLYKGHPCSPLLVPSVPRLPTDLDTPISMSFIASSQHVRLENGHILHARCEDERGNWVDSRIDLNHHIGNTDGKFPSRKFPLFLLLGLSAKKRRPRRTSGILILLWAHVGTGHKILLIAVILLLYVTQYPVRVSISFGL